MPLPPRPTGPTSPADLLWRHELREHNATLLLRMNALEAKFTDQEKRMQIAEQAATTCTDMAAELDLVKNGIDQLETKQQDFMSSVHKRLVNMDNDMGEFRKTQERVQKLLSSYRELDDGIAKLSPLGSRVEDAEREIQGLKNCLSRKCVQQIENLDARLETLELQRSREAAEIRTRHDNFIKKCNGDMHKLQTEVKRLMELRPQVEVQQPYMQVPRSPDVRPSSAIPKEVPLQHAVTSRWPLKSRREAGLQATKQTSAETRNVEDLDVDTNLVANMAASHRKTLPPAMSPRKKPKLSHPKDRPNNQVKAAPKIQPKPHAKAQSKPAQQHHTKQPSAISSPGSRPAPSYIVKLPVNLGKKRPGSPMTAPKSAKELRPAAKPLQQVDKGIRFAAKPRERKPQPSQTARRSRRGSANITFYELGWDHTQQPQKKAGPVYDGASKPLKTKPRRLPPVPYE